MQCEYLLIFSVIQSVSVMSVDWVFDKSNMVKVEMNTIKKMPEY